MHTKQQIVIEVQVYVKQCITLSRHISHYHAEHQNIMGDRNKNLNTALCRKMLNEHHFKSIDLNSNSILIY